MIPSYYACFQAAVAALLREGVGPQGGYWGHEYVPAQFGGVLINRRHRYPTDLRGGLERGYILRQTADYEDDPLPPGGGELDAVLRLPKERGGRHLHPRRRPRFPLHTGAYRSERSLCIADMLAGWVHDA